jgi:hypothetical protein
MRHILICSIILGFAFCLGSVQADDPVSGPRVGEVAKGFNVEVATGDDAGKMLDLLKLLKDKPVLLIFVSEMTRPGFGLLKLLDKEHKVLLNMARRAPERQDFDDVRKAIDKLLGPSPAAFPQAHQFSGEARARFARSDQNAAQRITTRPSS